MRALLILLSLYLTGMDANAAHQFAELRAAPYQGRSVAPVLKDPDSRHYATRLRSAAHRQPNFAGHYVLTAWGCGASCVMAAAVDAKKSRRFRLRSRTGLMQEASWGGAATALGLRLQPRAVGWRAALMARLLACTLPLGRLRLPPVAAGAAQSEMALNGCNRSNPRVCDPLERPASSVPETAS